MFGATILGAENMISAHLGRPKPLRCIPPRQNVRFGPESRHIEIMNHVFGRQSQPDIPVDRQIQTRDIVLLIDNKDSAPLVINAVEATRREVWIIFYAPAAGKYTLLTGNGKCPSAFYDVTGLALESRKVGSTIIKPGPLAENSVYHRAEAL